MKKSLCLIGAMCVVLLNSRARALNVASNQSANHAPVETESFTRTEQRAKTASQERAVAELNLTPRRAVKVESKPPAITAQGVLAIFLIGGTPLIMGGLILTMTRRALRLRDKELSAMRRCYGGVAERAEPTTPAPPRPKLPLNQFLERRKDRDAKAFLKTGSMNFGRRSGDINKTSLTPQPLAMKCDFNALLNGMQFLSSSGLRQTVPGYFAFFVAESQNFHRLLLDMDGQRLASGSQARPPSGEFKIIPPKEAVAARPPSGEYKLRMPGVMNTPMPRTPLPSTNRRQA